MSKRLWFIGNLLSVGLVLSSCYTGVSRSWLDAGKAGEAVLMSCGKKTKIPVTAALGEPELKGVPLFRAGGKVYVAGQRCKTRPFRQRLVYSILDDLSLSSCNDFAPCLAHAPYAARCCVYGEVQQTPTEDGRVVWQRTEAPWQESLPAGATPYASALAYRLTHPVRVNGSSCRYWAAEQTLAPRATAAAWYAYPMALFTFAVLDAPTYLLYHSPYVLTYPFSVVQQQAPAGPRFTDN